MTVTEVSQKTEYYYNDRIPLAIYREIVAHLESIDKVTTTTLIQDSPSFNYLDSQIKGICLEYPQDLDSQTQTQIQEILAYYGLK